MVQFRPRLSEGCKSPRCITAGMMDGCDRLEHALVSPREEARKEDISRYFLLSAVMGTFVLAEVYRTEFECAKVGGRMRLWRLRKAAGVRKCGPGPRALNPKWASIRSE